MKQYLIEKKNWYNPHLKIYQDILTMNDAPQDLLKFLKQEANIKISEFSSDEHYRCNPCFYYFLNNSCCNPCQPIETKEVNVLFNLLIHNGYSILYKETKLITRFNNNAICLIQKLN